MNDLDIQNAKPREQLRLVAEMVDRYDLGKYDPQFRTWALTDPLVARGVRRVNRARIELVGGILERVGFQGDELKMRTMLFVGYHTWERSMFREVSATTRRKLRDLRMALLLSKRPR